MSQWVEVYGSYAFNDGLSLIRFDIHVEQFEGGELHACLYRTRYKVTRETAACYVIDVLGTPKYVLKDQTGKRFAYLSDAYAIRSLKKRAYWRVAHAQNAVLRAEEAYALYKRTFEPDQTL